MMERTMEIVGSLLTERKQKLMTANLRKKIPKIREQEGVEDPIVYARFFNAYGGGTWLVTEFDGKDEMFGWAEIHPGMGEFGYMSLRELESLDAYFGGRKIPGLQAIERDTSFRPTPLSRAKKH
jgi:hypothetical protein